MKSPACVAAAVARFTVIGAVTAATVFSTSQSIGDDLVVDMSQCRPAVKGLDVQHFSTGSLCLTNAVANSASRSSFFELSPPWTRGNSSSLDRLFGGDGFLSILGAAPAIFAAEDLVTVASTQTRASHSVSESTIDWETRHAASSVEEEMVSTGSAPVASDLRPAASPRLEPSSPRDCIGLPTSDDDLSETDCDYAAFELDDDIDITIEGNSDADAASPFRHGAASPNRQIAGVGFGLSAVMLFFFFCL